MWNSRSAFLGALLCAAACARSPGSGSVHPEPGGDAVATAPPLAAGERAGDATAASPSASEAARPPARCAALDDATPRAAPTLANFPTAHGRVFRWAWVQLGCRFAPAPLDEPVEISRTRMRASLGGDASVSWRATFGAPGALHFDGYVDDSVKGALPTARHADYSHRLLRELLPFITGYTWLAPEALGLSGGAPLLVLHDARNVPLLALEDAGTFDRERMSRASRAREWASQASSSALVQAPLPAHTRIVEYYWSGWAEPPAPVEVWGVAEYVDTYAVGGATVTIPRSAPPGGGIPAALEQALAALPLSAAESLRLAYVLLGVGELHSEGACVAGARGVPTLRLEPAGAVCGW